MRERTKFYFTVVLPAIYFMAQGAYGLPKVREKLGLTSLLTQLEVQGSIIFLYLCYQFGPVRRDYKRFLQFGTSRSEVLESLHRAKLRSVAGEQFVEDMRVNVMIAGRKGLRYLEPVGKGTTIIARIKRRLAWGGRQPSLAAIFKYEFISASIKSQKEVLPRLTTNQGLCGDAFKGFPALLLPGAACELYQLREEQRFTIQDVKFGLSIPILGVPDRDGRSPVIGVLNIESRSEKLAQFLDQNPPKKAALKMEYSDLADICSKFYS